jgi:hypothetical protein
LDAYFGHRCSHDGDPLNLDDRLCRYRPGRILPVGYLHVRFRPARNHRDRQHLAHPGHVLKPLAQSYYDFLLDYRIRPTAPEIAPLRGAHFHLTQRPRGDGWDHSTRGILR